MNAGEDNVGAEGLIVHKLSLSYRGKGSPALDNISFVVKPSTFAVLVGKSGCGKSSLLRSIAGLEPAAVGAIRFNGRGLRALDARDREIGMVFQECPLFPSMSVEEVVAFPIRFGGRKEGVGDWSVEGVLRAMRLSELRRRRISTLSGGERQLTALARVLVWRPSLVLLDEPLSSVDAVLRPTIIREVRRFHEVSQTTTIYVTHEQSEAIECADFMLVMDEGRIVQVGAPEHLYNHPSSIQVAELVGDSPTAFLRGSVVNGSDDPMIVTIGEVRFEAQWARRPSPLLAVEDTFLIGIRADSLRLADHADGNMKVAGCFIRGNLRAVRFQGSRYLLEIEALGSRLFAWSTEKPSTAESLSVALESREHPVFRDPDGTLIGTMSLAPCNCGSFQEHRSLSL